MSTTQSHKKQRRIAASSGSSTSTTNVPTSGNTNNSSSNNSTTSTTLTPFQHDMEYAKSEEYQQLNEYYRNRLLHNSDTNGGTGRDSNYINFNHTREINEWIRLLRFIDIKYDIISYKNCKVMGMGNNEAQQLFPQVFTEDDTNENVLSNSNKLPTYVKLLPLGIRAICAGGLYSIVLSTNGIPYSWGASEDGALGRIKPITTATAGTTTSSSTEMDDLDYEAQPTPITGFYTTTTTHTTQCDDGYIIQIAAGETHTLFISLYGNVYQCGAYIIEGEKFGLPNHNNNNNTSGYNNNNNNNNNGCVANRTPVHVVLPKKAIAIAAGAESSAALLEDYTLVTWGISCRGALARIAVGTYAGKTSYEEIVTDTDGFSDKKRDYQMLKEHYLRPQPVMFDHTPNIAPKVIAVACGLYHIVVIARDSNSSQGKLYTSGLNNWGQLGHGDTNSRDKLTLVQDVKDEDFGYVAAGDNFSLALTHDRKVLYSFGLNNNSQLGLGFEAVSSHHFTTPQKVRFPDVMDIVSINAGHRHASVITSDHEVYTWGFNEEGQTGHENIKTKAEGFMDIYRPKLLKLDEHKCYPLQFSGGGQHSLLLVRPKLTE